MRQIETTDEVIRAVTRKLDPRWLRNGGVTDPMKALEEATAQINGTILDANERVLRIQRATIGIARSMVHDINAMADLRPNTHPIIPMVIRVRPIRIRQDDYEIEWTAFRVVRYVRRYPYNFTLFTDDQPELPTADCIVSLIRKGQKLSKQPAMGTSLLQRQYRVWLWRNRVWEAIRHDAWPNPLELWHWFNGRVTGKTCI